MAYFSEYILHSLFIFKFLHLFLSLPQLSGLPLFEMCNIYYIFFLIMKFINLQCLKAATWLDFEGIMLK